MGEHCRLFVIENQGNDEEVCIEDKSKNDEQKSLYP